MIDTQSNDVLTLLPCPFCGGTDLVFRQDEAEDDPGLFYAYHVFCRDCHCHGRNNFPIGWCESEEAAAEAWNLRGFKRWENYWASIKPLPEHTQTAEGGDKPQGE